MTKWQLYLQLTSRSTRLSTSKYSFIWRKNTSREIMCVNYTSEVVSSPECSSLLHKHAHHGCHPDALRMISMCSRYLQWLVVWLLTALHVFVLQELFAILLRHLSVWSLWRSINTTTTTNKWGKQETHEHFCEKISWWCSKYRKRGNSRAVDNTYEDGIHQHVN